MVIAFEGRLSLLHVLVKFLKFTTALYEIERFGVCVKQISETKDMNSLNGER